jgi:hypothetical protein
VQHKVNAFVIERRRRQRHVAEALLALLDAEHMVGGLGKRAVTIAYLKKKNTVYLNSNFLVTIC